MYDLDLHIHIWMYIINIMLSKKKCSKHAECGTLGDLCTKNYIKMTNACFWAGERGTINYIHNVQAQKLVESWLRGTKAYFSHFIFLKFRTVIL